MPENRIALETTKNKSSLEKLARFEMYIDGT
jgi:hypothetical protein